MRYLTRGREWGDLPDADADRAMEAYRARVAEITPRLPAALVRISHDLSLHDGVIEKIVWNPGLRRLSLALVCCDDTRGYFQALLTYGGAMLGPHRVEALRRAAISRETVLLENEVDVEDDGTLVHRLLFAPSEEVTIDCQEVDLIVTPREDTRVYIGHLPFAVEEPEEGPKDSTSRLMGGGQHVS